MMDGPLIDGAPELHLCERTCESLNLGALDRLKERSREGGGWMGVETVCKERGVKVGLLPFSSRPCETEGCKET